MAQHLPIIIRQEFTEQFGDNIMNVRMQVCLDQEIKKVCPIDGVSFGKLDDKSTWRIDYAKEATQEQKTEAQKILRDFLWDNNMKEKCRKDDRDNEYCEDLLMKKSYLDYKINFPNSSFSEFLDYLEQMKLE